MPTLNISVPNDFDSHDAESRMIQAVGSFSDSEDLYYLAYEILAHVAICAGLMHERDTDFGADWYGTNYEIDDAIAALPSWAHASVKE